MSESEFLALAEATLTAIAASLDRLNDEDVLDVECSRSGNVLEIDGKVAGGENSIMGEYPALYKRMAELVAAGQSEVDLAPMVHVADALTLGRRVIVDSFDF